MGSISFGIAFVAGKNRVPYPAAGNKHLVSISYRLSVDRSLKYNAFTKKQILRDLESFSTTVLVIEPQNIIFFQIKTRLNFDYFKIKLFFVLQPMARFLRDKA